MLNIALNRQFDLIRELPVLKLIQREGNVEEKRTVHEIHQLIGIKRESSLAGAN